jgi:adenine deaminase
LIASVHEPGRMREALLHIALDGSILALGLIDTHVHIETRW